MRYINLTGVQVRIVDLDSQVHIYIPEGRVQIGMRYPERIVEDGFPISVATVDGVIGLPPAQDGITYIVPSAVAMLVQRADVLSPGQLVRDDDGEVLYAEGFQRFVPPAS